MKRRKYLWFPIPTQLFTQGQWSATKQSKQVRHCSLDILPLLYRLHSILLTIHFDNAALTNTAMMSSFGLESITTSAESFSFPFRRAFSVFSTFCSSFYVWTCVLQRGSVRWHSTGVRCHGFVVGSNRKHCHQSKGQSVKVAHKTHWPHSI